jgi:hypothetical protein
MPKANQAAKSDGPQCSCGPLTPQTDDQEILFATQPQEVIAKIMLCCDNQTGVFFFRNDQKLYLRVVTAT